MARFFRRGTSKIIFVPTIANPAQPTRSELSAGTPLTNQVAEIAGFALSNSPIAAPDMGAVFTKSIPGEDTTDTSTLTFYDDNAASTIRTALAKGVTGYIVLMPYGDVSAKRCETWPVQSTGVNDEWSAGNDPARYMVGFAIMDVPTQNALIPASS